MLTSKKINNKFKMIPYIVDGKENTLLSDYEMSMCRNSIKLMATDSVNDRLTENYSKYLKLESMYIYSLLWDIEYQCPVMFSGAQHMSKNCCRLFSRYYLFTNYRTLHTDNLYAKVDDFKVDMLHLENTKNKYPFIFWSRDRGTGFFKRIKKARPDVFNSWSVYPSLVEILWKDNFQGIIYTNTSEPETYLKELRFNK